MFQASAGNKVTMAQPAGMAPPPIPASVSAAARQSLARPAHRRPPLPDSADAEGWLRHIQDADGALLAWYRGQESPGNAAADAGVAECRCAGVRTFVASDPQLPTDAHTPVYLEFHGGAFVYGSGELCRLSTGFTALDKGMTVWGVDYRMPPLHPFPAAVDDAFAVYRELLRIREPHEIHVGGGSAGGNLAAALVARARDEGLPVPASLVLLTPELDLTGSGDSFEVLAGIDGALSGLREISALYAGGHDPADPLLSPLFADLTGFPPAFLQSGTRDPLLSDTVRMHRRLLAAGVPAELHVFEAMPHGGFGAAPEDLEVRAAVRDFLDRRRSALTE
jgi:epsilon-lactone hydrolase